jgi:hypothetical protein
MTLVYLEIIACNLYNTTRYTSLRLELFHDSFENLTRKDQLHHPPCHQPAQRRTATHPSIRLKLASMRTTYLTALSLTICAAFTIAVPPPAGLESRNNCVEDGQCSLGGPSDRGQSCSDLNCCSGQKTGAGNGVSTPQPSGVFPLTNSLWSRIVVASQARPSLTWASIARGQLPFELTMFGALCRSRKQASVQRRPRFFLGF